MEITVTLNISEYNQIYLKAIQHDDLKVENKQLKEELAIAHKQLEELQQPKDDTPTCTVKLDGSEVYEAVKKVADEFTKELEKEERKQIRKIQYDALQNWLDERRGIIAYDKNNPKKRNSYQ
ncbi:hypothetical protein CW684_04490 [Macrococcoides caseolyticum]|uniref:hypothetical protein n=1 Tax=Macrococcoides caseolyticum TaxID=69966 RepID=UPI000C31C6C5|nr:hypothetical protein [Macrococcus caseolyticus]PKF21655.1 hypothetical protein CW684_04490 [Macrococcus caseolyticus]PKF35653.1 hypothetical protein CW687_04490 [Macrococcus caseolyticus]